MGNGSRLVIDTETSSLCTTQAIDINMMAAITKLTRPNILMMPMYYGPTSPQYSPTPWADMWKLTKRQVAVAKLHTVVAKLIKIDDETWDEIVDKSTSRLKRAKWAQYKNLK